MKRRIACFCCGLMLLAASGASAGGMNLSWNDCGLAGVQNMSFACNTNVGPPFVMYASFDPPVNLPNLIGGTAEIWLQSEGATLPAWWQFRNPGSCRETSMSASADFTSGPISCANPWMGGAVSSVGYTVGGGGPNTAEVVAAFGVPVAQAIHVDAGTEYYAFSITINRAKSTGTGACGGCADPVCIFLYRMRLVWSGGLAETCINNPLDRRYISWQGGAVALGCPPTHGDLPRGDCTTPAFRNTWGQVKSLYR